MNTFEKKLIFLLSIKYFLSKKSGKRTKNCCCDSTFFAVFLEKDWKYNNERQKILRLRNTIAEEFVGFLFFEKSKHTEEEQENCEIKQQILFRGATIYHGTSWSLFWGTLSIIKHFKGSIEFRITKHLIKNVPISPCHRSTFFPGFIYNFFLASRQRQKM